MLIRQAVPSELASLRELRNQSALVGCRDVYTPEQLTAWLARPLPKKMLRLIESGSVIVAELGVEVAGYAALDLTSQEVEAVFVLPAYAGCGVGRALLRELEAMALISELNRLSLSASLNAVSFYRAAGYRSVSSGELVLNDSQSLGYEKMEKCLTANIRTP